MAYTYIDGKSGRSYRKEQKLCSHSISPYNKHFEIFCMDFRIIIYMIISIELAI